LISISVMLFISLV